MAGHDWFTRFDRRVCEGTHPDVAGECPKKQERRDDVLGQLLRETRVGRFIGRVTGRSSIARCGVCGCTLAGLDMADAPPPDCIRREHHE